MNRGVKTILIKVILFANVCENKFIILLFAENLNSLLSNYFHLNISVIPTLMNSTAIEASIIPITLDTTLVQCFPKRV